MLDPDRKIFLGMPSYGLMSGGASRAFWRASRLPDAQVYQQYQEGSLLAANNNVLWCSALNLARTGNRVDYFAMIHSDIEASDYWVDTLIDELEARDLDVINVPAAIKDTKGITSTALARPDGDTWRILCRLSLAELHRLPETFTSDDLGGHPILINTGLWVCRFREEWARKVWFTINDRIVVGPDGEYRPECESEDWFFGRLLNELGLRVGCTRKVAIRHRGPFEFPNDHVWGEPFDKAMVEASVVPEGDTFPLPEIAGWLKPGEGQTLAELAAGKRVLEIGSFFGLSTVVIAREAEHVVSLDPHDGRGAVEGVHTLAGFQFNLAYHGVASKVTTLVGTVADTHLEPYGPFALIYIDGAHDLANVQADIRAALKLITPDGLLAFHDYASGIDPEVTQAVDLLLADGAELLSVVDSLAVVRPPAFSFSEV